MCRKKFIVHNVPLNAAKAEPLISNFAPALLRLAACLATWFFNYHNETDNCRLKVLHLLFDRLVDALDQFFWTIILLNHILRVQVFQFLHKAFFGYPLLAH